MHHDQAIGEQPGVPKDFRRQAHSFGAEGATSPGSIGTEAEHARCQRPELGRRAAGLASCGRRPAAEEALTLRVGTVRYVSEGKCAMPSSGCCACELPLKKRRRTSESSCLVGHKGLSDTEQADD
jgi:hypothetical protein